MQIQLKVLDKLYYGVPCDPNHEIVLGEEYLVDGYCIKKSKLPGYGTPESAGMDLRTMKDFTLLPNTTMLIPTGIAIHINDPNVAAHIMPRSGLGHKEGVILGNTIGLIDSDYQGELMLSMWNRSTTTRYFRRGDRVAQLVFLPIIRATLEIVEEFQTSDRGQGGWGHTGV